MNVFMIVGIVLLACAVGLGCCSIKYWKNKQHPGRNVALIMLTIVFVCVSVWLIIAGVHVNHIANAVSAIEINCNVKVLDDADFTMLMQDKGKLMPIAVERDGKMRIWYIEYMGNDSFKVYENFDETLVQEIVL